MALEQKLSLKLAQKLVMTPSLQQAIKLLQMTRLELEGVLSQELEENPILETNEEAEERAEPESGVDEVAEAQEPAETEPEDPLDPASMDEVDLDSYFNDYLDVGDGGVSQTYEVRDAVPIENTLTREDDLYDHLLFQLQMMELEEEQREIVELIVGNLDEDGFLVASIEELQLLGAGDEDAEEYHRKLERWEAAQQRKEEEPEAEEKPLPKGFSPALAALPLPPGVKPPEPVEEEIEEQDDFADVPDEPPEVPGFTRKQVKEALAVVRELDPPGVASRDLRECLLYQLRQIVGENSLAFEMVDQHWPQFLKRQFQQIAKAMGCPLKDLQEPVEEIKQLETRPGRSFSGNRTQYVEPDVAVAKVGDEYVVQINDDGMPRLRVSRAYRNMLREMRREGGERDAQQYIKEKMRSAVWLIKSLDQRQRTIYKVANSIVKQQQGFLEKGVDHLRPMVLRDVAEDIGMHESTVSRVVSNKYINTPRGLYPMKFFFHSGIDRDYGEDISSLSVKGKIKALVQGEDPKKPLSDSELMRRLNAEDIKIARRTVAKYRDELGIPSSTDRKKIF
ncbi:MAG: RNA polymerase factor sigma-54 [Acidobacteriota bacterium]